MSAGQGGGAPAQSRAAAGAPGSSTPWGLLIAASAGNALEFYDFIVFGYFAEHIGHAFFSAVPQSAQALQVWGIFAAGFLGRPVGALVLGSYADRAGRRAAMTLAIWLMTLGTAILVFLPPASIIGGAAPGFVLLARLIQGFSAGGEFGGSTAFMLEHGDRSRRGYFASFQFVSQAVSNIAASIIGLCVTLALTQQQLLAWGFRIPFAVGLLIGPVGWYLRRHVPETPEFLAATPEARPALAAMSRAGGRILLAALAICLGTVATYVNIYLPSFASAELHMPGYSGFLITFLAGLVALVVTPIAAIWSDRTHRLRPALLGAAFCLAAAVPLLHAAIHHLTTATLALAILLLTAARAAYSAPLAAGLAELFPVEIRGVGLSLGYTLGVAVFGGSTPYACTQAVRLLHDPLAPAYVICLAAAVSLLALARANQLLRRHSY